MRIVVRVLAILAIATSFSAQQPPPWRWPEQPKNVKVLTDYPGEKLRPIMFGFTRSLGVSCAYCHVGEEGKPFRTFDFASDANPNKDRAREMLRMLADINGHLKKIQPSQPTRVNMWCHTCHQGRPRPTSLEDELNAAYTQGGVTAAVTRYTELRDKFYGKAGYDFSEGALNLYGYDLLEKKDFDGAIAILTLNAKNFPQSGNAWDSLAEAYRTAGKPRQSEIYYRKSLELDPKNANAEKKLTELEAAAAAKKP